MPFGSIQKLLLNILSNCALSVSSYLLRNHELCNIPKLKMFRHFTEFPLDKFKWINLLNNNTTVVHNETKSVDVCWEETQESQIIGFYERGRTEDARRKPKTIQKIDKTRRVVRSSEFEMGHCVGSYLKKSRLSLSFIGLVSYKKNGSRVSRTNLWWQNRTFYEFFSFFSD